MKPILRHKADFHKFESSEIIQSMVSEHNRITVEINNRRNHGKNM